MIFLNDYFLINNPFNNLKINSKDIVKEKILRYNEKLLDTTNDDNATIYSDSDYYTSHPRFTTSIIEENIKIDSPPGKAEEDDKQLLYIIGPMLTMTMSSPVNISASLINLANDKFNFTSIIPVLVIAVCNDSFNTFIAFFNEELN